MVKKESKKIVDLISHLPSTTIISPGLITQQITSQPSCSKISFLSDDLTSQILLEEMREKGAMMVDCDMADYEMR